MRGLGFIWGLGFICNIFWYGHMISSFNHPRGFLHQELYCTHCMNIIFTQNKVLHLYLVWPLQAYLICSWWDTELNARSGQGRTHFIIFYFLISDQFSYWRNFATLVPLIQEFPIKMYFFSKFCFLGILWSRCKFHTKNFFLVTAEIWNKHSDERFPTVYDFELFKFKVNIYLFGS